MVLCIEVGGSSVQAVVVDVDGTARGVELSGCHAADQWLVAAPGLVVGDRVQGAHHLGWLDTSIREQLGMDHPAAMSMNDAEAAAVGEWVALDRPAGLTLYIGIGTGVGAVAIDAGETIDLEFGHLTSFGPKTCAGCGRLGCLDAQIGGHALPTPLSASDRDFVASALVAAVHRQTLSIARIVLGGGMLRTYPEIVDTVRQQLTVEVVASGVGSSLKSAAHLGLVERWAGSPT